MVILITGKADAGKTHYGQELKKELEGNGYTIEHLNGDVFRAENNDQDYSVAGRERNLLERLFIGLISDINLKST
jgi:adenylylsulfate kinase-like enzyme